MFFAYFDKNGEVEMKEKDIQDLGPGEKTLYSNTQLESLVKLAESNWNTYEKVKQQYEETLNEWLVKKDKIVKKMIETSNS